MLTLKIKHAPRVPVVGASLTKKWHLTAALCIGLLSTNGVSAALVSSLGGQIVNDTTNNIAWLANANLAATNTFGVTGINPNGSMSWFTAQKWISAMNAVNYLGYNDWRLSASDTCMGYNCTKTEMGNLFYNGLGGVAHSSIIAAHNANLALFNNVQSGIYWSGMEYAPGTACAWNFGTYGGFQDTYGKGGNLFVVAVRSGQVSAVGGPVRLHRKFH